MRKISFISMLTILLFSLGGFTYADDCDDAKEECITVTAKRITDRPDYFDGMFNQPFIPSYVPPTIGSEDGRESQQCRDRVAREVAAEAAAAGGACGLAMLLIPLPLVDEGLGAAVCSAFVISYTRDEQDDECGHLRM